MAGCFNSRNAALFPMVTMTFVAASAKFAQLVPLLVQWNSASSPKSDFIRCYNFGELLAPRGKLDNTVPVARIGLHQVAVHDGALVKEILMGDVKIIEKGANGVSQVMMRSNTNVDGYMIPAGTLVMLDQGQ